MIYKNPLNKKIKFLIIIFIIFVLVFLIFYLKNYTNKKLYADEINKVNIHFFYSEDCDICLETLDKLNNLIQEKYSYVNLKTYEISRDDENLNLLFYLLDAYKCKEYHYDIPIVFIGKYILVGAKNVNNIELTLKDFLEKNLDHDPTENLISDYLKINDKDYFLEGYITIPLVIVSGLVDSVNPCAIAVIMFLIVTVVLTKDRIAILKYGLIYIVTIFIVYFSLGIGIIYLFNEINIHDLFFIIIGSILILFGIWSIKDYFWYGKGISLGIPKFMHSIIGENIRKATIPSMILLGIIVSVFESACSGAIYLGILSMISKQGLDLGNLMLLIFYNFLFILPLLIILMVFYFGLSVIKVKKYLEQNLARKSKNLYRLVGGAILIFLGIYLIFWI